MASTVWRGHLTFGLISIPIRLFRAARAERIPLRRVARARSAEPAAMSDSDEERDDAATTRPGSSNGGMSGKSHRSTLAVGNRPSPEIAGGSNGEVLSAGISARSEQPLVPVRQTSVAATSGAIVPEAQVTRAVEVRKNQFVEIPPEELKSLKAETSQDMAIQQFVALREIDPLYFETSYYVIPGQVGERAYALLYQALLNKNVVALAEVAMHGRDHVVVVRPGSRGLVAHTMFYQTEVHLDEQFQADSSSVQAKELALAETLIGSLTANFEPEQFKNAYREKLEALIAGKVGQVPGEAPNTVPRTAEVVDIADALRRSLAQLKKPVQASADSGEKPKTSDGSARPSARRRATKGGAA